MTDLAPHTRREIAELRDLVRRPRARADAGVIVLEGRRLIADALRRGEARSKGAGVLAADTSASSGAAVTRLVIDRDRLDRDGRLHELVDLARRVSHDRVSDDRIALGTAPPERFARLSTLHSPPGVLAIARRPRFDLDTILARPRWLIVAALGVQDPTNLGALVRNAAAFGVDALVCAHGSADPLGPKSIRASAGAVLDLPSFELRASEVRARVGATPSAELPVRILAADPRGETPIEEIRASARDLLVIGGESGLPEGFLQPGDTRLRIPVEPAVESLNLVSAAAIALHHLARSRPL